MTDTPSPHARLREVAEKATPGRWGVEDPHGPEMLSVVANPEAPVYHWKFVANCTMPDEDDHDLTARDVTANAEYIAAANPQVVIGLLDEIEGLRSTVRQREESLSAAVDHAAEGFQRASSLEAKLREAEATIAALRVQCGLSPEAPDSEILLHIQAEMRHLNEAQVAARQNARTPGTVEVCAHHLCLHTLDGTDAKYPSRCSIASCPIRTASPPEIGTASSLKGDAS